LFGFIYCRIAFIDAVTRDCRIVLLLLLPLRVNRGLAAVLVADAPAIR